MGNTDSWKEAFEVDITDVVMYGKPNVVADCVSDRAGAGGIWRPVWLNPVASPVPAEKNLISDPGFEEEAKAWRKSTMIGTFDFTSDGLHSHNGKHSGRIRCSARGVDAKGAMKTDVWGRWYQTGISVQPDCRYRLRLWVKAKLAPTGRVSVWVTGTEKNTMAANIADSGGRWVEVIINDIEPKGEAVGVYLNLRHAPGIVWFDDVELLEAP